MNTEQTSKNIFMSISKYLHSFLEEKIFPEEQKGCERNSWVTKDQPLSDKTVCRDCQKRSTNLAMAGIDYWKVYDIIPYGWMYEYDKVKEKEIKAEFARVYKRNVRLILSSKLNEKNKKAAINTWTVSLLTYSAGISE